jgi:hypothetical protein
MVVVLPAPFVPRSPRISSPATSKSMPWIRSTSPYDLRSPWTSMTGGTG